MTNRLTIILLVVSAGIVYASETKEEVTNVTEPKVPEIKVTVPTGKVGTVTLISGTLGSEIKVTVPTGKVEVPTVKTEVSTVKVEVPTVKLEPVAIQVNKAENIWVKYIAIFLSGGGVVWVFNTFYKEFSRTRKAKEVFERHLDPVLKAADQLLGQMFSLSQKDFKSVYTDDDSAKQERIFVLYLFAQFWARLEILKKESIHVHISKQKKGGLLLQFLRALRAKKNRMSTRVNEQAIAESIMFLSDGTYRIMTFFQFLNEYSNNTQISDRFKILDERLLGTWDREKRQQILCYGVILHVLTDTLDPKHVLIRERKPYTNKLSKKTRAELKCQVFNIYLPTAKSHRKYWEVK